MRLPLVDRPNMNSTSRSLLQVVCLLVLAARLAHANPSPVPIPLTLVDVPEAVVSPQRAPTWEQALDLVGGLFRAGHLGIHAGFARLSTAWWSVLLETFSTTSFDWLMNMVLPPVLWLHEEGHRAVMAVNGLPSKNVANNLFYAPGERCDRGAVCGMTDDQIAAVKSRRAADWVRVQAAGMETELELMRRLERDAFFSEQPRALNIPISIILNGSVLAYRHACAEGSFGEADITRESPDMLRRDFTGPDCTGFVVDLFRPNEPFAARGPHPNGDGLRRFRLKSDLTDAERSYLIRVRNLGLLNIVDPALFGFPRFDVVLGSGKRLSLGASLQHDLTAFGDAFGLSVLASYESWQGFATVRLYRNEALVLPGLTVALRRRALRVGSVTLIGSAQLDLWLQPRDFAYSTTVVIPGGAVEAQLAVPVGGPFEVFAALRAKSAGWRPVDPFLDAAFSGRLGVNVLMPVL